MLEVVDVWMWRICGGIRIIYVEKSWTCRIVSWGKIAEIEEICG
jgi:hypothetical protein